MQFCIRVIALFFVGGALGLAAGQTTRPVNLSWTASTTSGVTGYTVATGTSAAGPFTQVGCAGTVPGSTCAPCSASLTSACAPSATSYVDVETVGGTIYYQVAAVAAACTPTTPVTQGCGASVPVATSTTIPPKPVILSLVLLLP
jgi:hypothetical protein